MSEQHEIVTKKKRVLTPEQRARKSEQQKKKRKEKKEKEKEKEAAKEASEKEDKERDNEKEEDDEEELQLARTITKDVEDLKIAFENPSFMKQYQNEEFKSVAMRFILMGKNFGEFAVFQDFEQKRMTRDTYKDLQADVFAKVDEVAEQKLSEIKRHYKESNQPTIVEIDCRWAIRKVQTETSSTSD